MERPSGAFSAGALEPQAVRDWDDPALFLAFDAREKVRFGCLAGGLDSSLANEAFD